MKICGRACDKGLFSDIRAFWHIIRYFRYFRHFRAIKGEIAPKRNKDKPPYLAHWNYLIFLFIKLQICGNENLGNRSSVFTLLKARAVTNIFSYQNQ